MSVRLAKPEHEVAYQEVTALLKRHADATGLSALDMLAVAANMLGKLVALQDQRSVSPEMAMRVVAANLECGNRQVIDELSRSARGSA